LYWEIVWLYINNDFHPGETILDLGGSSSLFSYYLVSKGLDVTTVDLQKNLVDNANHVAREMGWKLRNYTKDIKTLNFDEPFDHVTSVCVYEHIPLYDRIAINRQIKDTLREGGSFSITFDYKNPSKEAGIASPADIQEQFIKPSGLALRGNSDFYDNDEKYLLHPFYGNLRLLEWWRLCSCKVGG
jgi:cyclopropane fatty-acyl-phospholipid synthase-like methyltransferase